MSGKARSSLFELAACCAGGQLPVAGASFRLPHSGMKRFVCVLLFFLLHQAATAADGLEGKVMCGYQGWFRVPEDGSKNGWI